MRKVVKLLGVIFLAFAVAITSVAISPVTAEAATMLNVKTIKTKVGKDVKIKLKSKYTSTHYITSVKKVSGDSYVVESTYGMSPDQTELVFTAAKKGSIKLGITVKNRTTGNSKVCNVKITVSNKVDFEVVDVKGKTKNISKYFGKPMVINVWADWCGWCTYEMPDMYKAYKNYKSDVRFMFIGVDCYDYSSSQAKQAQKFLKGYAGGTLPTYMDKNSSVKNGLSVNSWPKTVFIDKKGNVVYEQSGAYTSYSSLESDIKKYLLK